MTAIETNVDVLQLVEKITGTILSRTIFAVCELGVPDLCVEEARRADELAELVGADGPTLHRLLRYLSGHGLFEEDASGRFRLTPAGDPLRDASPTGLRSLVSLVAEMYEPSTAAFLYTARTGLPAFDWAHECTAYQHLGADTRHEAMFATAMHGRAVGLGESLVAAVDWSDVACIVDVGGSRGALLALLLEHLPGVRGVLLDQPHVVARARAVFADGGVADRVDIVGGNFFDSVPLGGDVYLVANVLWNWDDDHAAAILRRCHEAMAPSARLVVFEPVVPTGNDWHPAKTIDVVNLLVFGGRARTEHEWHMLFGAGGFRLTAQRPAASEWTVMEAVRQP